MNYRIRRAMERDLPEMERIYAAARAIMEASGNPNQWGKHNPPAALLREDIRRGNLYLICGNDGIHGAFALISGEDPTYREIYGGSWSRNVPYSTIHRLAGDGSGGIFSACLAYCRENCGYLRIDTHRDNRIMLGLLEKHGFTRCGIIYLENGSERIAFDLCI